MPPSTAGSDSRAASLRLVHGQASEQTAPERDPTAASRPRKALRLVEDGSSVLVAGADTARRAVLLAELANTMPEGTAFEQASTFAEVLEHAPRSRMVILSGGLDDASSRSLMRVLGQRHPKLPVITVDAGPGEL
jgi:hypothetical protein